MQGVYHKYIAMCLNHFRIGHGLADASIRGFSIEVTGVVHRILGDPINVAMCKESYKHVTGRVEKVSNAADNAPSGFRGANCNGNPDRSLSVDGCVTMIYDVIGRVEEPA